MKKWKFHFCLWIKKKILINNNEKDEDVENGNININNTNINTERNDKLNNKDKKEINIETIEEYNENENENENSIQRLKKEFENYEEKLLYKSCDNIHKNFNIDINKEKEKNIKNRSMKILVKFNWMIKIYYIFHLIRVLSFDNYYYIFYYIYSINELILN